jgi:hypothetical protein
MLLHRSDYQITFVNQPMMKLIGGISAIVLADLPYLLIFLRALLLLIQLQLNRTPHVLAELPSLIVYISVD